MSVNDSQSFIIIFGRHLTGWIGPDHPETATEEWGRKMLQTTADYIVDFMEEFKKVDIAKACGTEF